MNPASARVPPGRPAAVRRARHPVHGRRGADRPRAHRPVVRLPALRRAARRRDDGQGARQRPADRRVLGAGRRGRRVRARRPRHDVRRPAARHRDRASRAGGDGAHRRAGAGARCRRAPHRRRCAELDGCRRRAGLGLLIAAQLDDGHDAARRSRPTVSPPGSSSTPSRRPRCGSRRRSPSPTSEIDEAVAILGKVLASGPTHEALPRRRRPVAGRARRRPRSRRAARPRRPLAGKGVALYFAKPSLRTRHSCEMAVVQLGGHPVDDASATRSTPARASRGATSPACSPATTPSWAPASSTTTTSRRWPSRTRCRSSTCCPTPRHLPGARRPAHDAPAARAARRADRLLRRRLQQRRPLAVARRGDERHERASRLPARLRPDRRRSRPSRRARLRSVRRRRDPDEAAKGADAVHTDVWTSMGFEDREPSTGRERSKASRSTTG